MCLQLGYEAVVICLLLDQIGPKANESVKVAFITNRFGMHDLHPSQMILPVVKLVPIRPVSNLIPKLLYSRFDGFVYFNAD